MYILYTAGRFSSFLYLPPSMFRDVQNWFMILREILAKCVSFSIRYPVVVDFLVVSVSTSKCRELVDHSR